MSTLAQLLDAHARYHRASAKAIKALRAHFVPGRHVVWAHGGPLRSGTVVEVVGTRYHHARIIVRSDTSRKRVVIDAQRILEEERQTHEENQP